MSNGEERGLRAQYGKATRGTTMKQQLRRATSPNHFDVAPQDLLGVAGAERLHRCLLGGEPAGKMDSGVTASLGIGDFPASKDAAEESIAVSFDGCRDAWDVGCIEAEANNVGH